MNNTNKKQKVKTAEQQEVQAAVYKVGDMLVVNGKNVKVVELLEPGRLHVKNVNEPHDSFIVLAGEV